jgi:pimeloyl-ACP methyl ester carboxylesterase
MPRIPMSSAVLLALALFVHVSPAQGPAPRLVDVGGHKLNVQVTGTSKPGVPTVVFEAGLGSPLASWNGINLMLGDSVRVIAYDRAGIGASEPGTLPPTAKNVVAELHTLLAKVGAAPPYVLVGHSLGGPFIHVFAATYPKEVAGMVHIDPSDFTQTDAGLNAIWEKVGVKNGRDLFRAMMAQMLTGAPPGIAAEWREVDRVERGGFAEFRAAGDSPDVPTVVLLAGKPDAVQPGAPPFPGGYDAYHAATQAQRIEHFSRLTSQKTKGTFIVTSRSGHFIHMSEPELALWAIRRVVSLAMPRPELDRFVGEYPLAPTFAITITRDDDKLVLQATGQPAGAMSQESATTFAIKPAGVVIEFETDAAGKVTALVLLQGGQRHRAPKK